MSFLCFQRSLLYEKRLPHPGSLQPSLAFPCLDRPWPSSKLLFLNFAPQPSSPHQNPAPHFTPALTAIRAPSTGFTNSLVFFLFPEMVCSESDDLFLEVNTISARALSPSFLGLSCLFDLLSSAGLSTASLASKSGSLLPRSSQEVIVSKTLVHYAG